MCTYLEMYKCTINVEMYTNTHYTKVQTPAHSRRRHEQAERDKKLWIIPRDDLQMVGSRFRSSLSIVSVHLIWSFVCLSVCLW